MSNFIRIGELASIRTGYTFRKGDPDAARSGLLGLQIGDIRDTCVIDPSRLSSVDWHGSGQPPVLEPGDVVLAAKGGRNPAAMFMDSDALVLPSSQFLVLRVTNTARMLPGFLCWILNFGPTQHRLSEVHGGTNIPSLSKKALLEVAVPAPPIAVQQTVLDLQALWDEERQLNEELMRNREKMLHGVWPRLLNGETK